LTWLERFRPGTERACPFDERL